MEKIRFFTQVLSWKKGHELAIEIYKVTKAFPTEEKYGLISQMRRSSVSVTSNIAEGFGRRTRSDKLRFYDISIGSLYELQNQLLLARDVSLLSAADFKTCNELAIETRFLLLTWMSGT